MEMVLEAKKAWMPNRLAPSSFRRRNAWASWGRVMPYLASPGLSITWKPSSLSPRANTPPGLKRQHTVSGTRPSVSCKKSTWVRSSRLI